MDTPVQKSTQEQDEISPAFTSRRNLLSMGTAASLAGLLGTSAASAASGQPRAISFNEINVKNFGARGDGSHRRYRRVPARARFGAYRRRRHSLCSVWPLSLSRCPQHSRRRITLRGSFSCVPSHTGTRDKGQPKPGDDGTALLCWAGRGSEDGKPFHHAQFQQLGAGLVIYYPEQVTEPTRSPIPGPSPCAEKSRRLRSRIAQSHTRASTPAATSAITSATFAASRCGAASGSMLFTISAASKTCISIRGGLAMAPLSMANEKRRSLPLRSRRLGICLQHLLLRLSRWL
jgi:hypothetical protein